MKKLFALCLTVVLMISCLTACDLFEKKPGYDPSLKCVKYENCAVFIFNDFSSEKAASFELERKGLGEGVIYYQVNLEEGALSIYYKDTVINTLQSLGEFTADDEMPINSSGGYVEGDKITINFESDTSVTGEIIIAFTEDALKAVHKDIQLHKHTYEYETREDAHKRIYTCDCTNLETRDFEPHFDEDGNGECDECEFYIGIPHEDHNWGYDVNETSHRQIFGCGCESPENYEAHYNNDGDNLCDACGYVMSEAATNTGKVQTKISEDASLPQFMSLEADKHNALSNGSAINVDVYMGYDILNKDGAAFSDIVVPESDFAKYTFVLEINYNNETRTVALDTVNYFEEYRCDMYQGVVQYSKYNTVQLDTTKMTGKSYGFVNLELYMISDTNERYFVSAEALYYSVTDTEIVFGLVSNPVANEGDPGIITKGWEYKETTP